jgi:membrane protein implicated in regulation of membrane protease activity
MVVPIEDLIFVVCTLIGGGLLLITVLVDDILGGVLDALHIGFDIGGVSLMPLLLGFVSMFGVGGLFATQVLDLHAGPAAIVGTVGGVIGFLIVFVMFSVLRRSEGSNPFSTSSLVGRPASVSVSIPAGRFGTVLVKAEGQTHEFSATASVDIATGTPVTVTATAGTGLVVVPVAPPPTTTPTVARSAAAEPATAPPTSAPHDQTDDAGASSTTSGGGPASSSGATGRGGTTGA